MEPVLVRRPRPGGDAHAARRRRRRSTATSPSSVPTDRGMLAALEALLATYRAPTLAELPPLHGGLMGYLGYDVVREVERLPDVPPDDLGAARRGAVRDRLARRVRPLAPAGLRSSRACRRTAPATPTLDAAYDAAVGAHRALPSPTSPARCRTCRSSRRDRDDPLPDVRSTMAGGRLPAGGRGGQGAHPRRRHLPGRARPALRPRPRRRPVRRLPGAAPGQPEPVHVLRAPPRSSRSSARRPSRWCSCSTAR